MKFIKKIIKKQKNKKDIDNTLNQSMISIEILKLQNENIMKQIELEELKQKNNIDDKNNEINEIKIELELKIQNNNLLNDSQSNGSCIDCKKNISKKHKRCNKCEGKRRYNMNCLNRPSYNQLLKDKKELKYYTRVAEKYNVSDNCIRKWIKNYEKNNKKIDI